jgi:predicted kinase
MTPYLFLTRALPGAGKTTWARETFKATRFGSTKLLCGDELRAMLDLNVGGPDAIFLAENETFMEKVKAMIVVEALSDGKHVIVHDTFSDVGRAIRLRDATEGLCRLRIVEFDTPMEVCIERDANREKHVGVDVIERINDVARRNDRSFERWPTVTPDEAKALLVSEVGR